MSLGARAGVRGFGPPHLLLVPAVALSGAVLAFGLLALPAKTEGALVGAALVSAVALLSGHARSVLLFLLVLLIGLDVKTYQDIRPHIGGAPGLVITAQMALLVPLFAISVAQRVIEPGREQTARLPAGALLVPLIPVIAFLPSLFGARVPGLSVYESLRLVAYYFLYLYFAIEFRRSDAPLVIAAFLLGVLLEVPFAALQFGLPGFRISIIGQDAAGVAEPLSVGSLSRVTGTQTHPNIFASYLVMLLPLAMLLVWVRIGGQRLRRLARVTLLAAVVMLVLTFSRGAWVGIVIGVPVTLVLAALRGHITPGRTAVTILALTVCCGILLAMPPVWQRLVASDPTNVNFRLDINQVAVAMWQSSPITGIGLNNFVENMIDFDVHQASFLNAPVHNIYLLTLAETGLLGALGMAVYLVWSAFQALRASRTEDTVLSLVAIGFLGGLLALYVAELASFSTRADSILQAFAILLGIVIATIRLSPASGPGGAVRGRLEAPWKL